MNTYVYTCIHRRLQVKTMTRYDRKNRENTKTFMSTYFPDRLQRPAESRTQEDWAWLPLGESRGFSKTKNLLVWAHAAEESAEVFILETNMTDTTWNCVCRQVLLLGLLTGVPPWPSVTVLIGVTGNTKYWKVRKRDIQFPFQRRMSKCFQF